MNDISSDEQSGIAPSTIFFPLHRIEKILLDENVGESPSLASMFMLRIGTSIDEYL